MKAAGSRHAIMRYRFNHVKVSVWHDTWPKMMELCFPEIQTTADKADWFIEFPNKSQVWFGGLDEKERTEKILGQEYSTIFLNEISQIGWDAVELSRTRLAQNSGLRLKLYYDCNPPLSTHWSHRIFVQKRSPAPPHEPLANPDNYTWFRLNPADNAKNLPSDYLKELQSLSARSRIRFWEGEWGSAAENALWTYETIEKHRRTSHPDLQRVVVAVDPSGTSGDESDRSDHVGIVVVGLGIDGECYVLEDLTVKAPPAVWGKVVVTAADRHMADCIVAETNFGGAMVEHVVQGAASQLKQRVVFREVTASRGKAVRAEPISVLYEQGKVHHVGSHPELEDQLCAFTTAGYTGDRSPDRADALIWGLTSLFPKTTRPPRSGAVVVEGVREYRPHGF